MSSPRGGARVDLTVILTRGSPDLRAGTLASPAQGKVEAWNIAEADFPLADRALSS